MRTLLSDNKKPDHKQLHEKMEPYRTLKKVSKDDENQPIFGINLISPNLGIIRVGDNVQILK